MSELTPTLAGLADHYGIAREFWDWKGRHTSIRAAAVVAVLAALGVEAATEEQQEAALSGLDAARWRRVLPRCTVIEQGQPLYVNVHVPAGSAVEVGVRTESGGWRQAWQVDNWAPDREIDGAWRGEATFGLGDDVETGYHRLVARTVEGEHEEPLIVTPSFVGIPATIRGGRVWGYAAQLYSVSGAKGWGVGDLADLADLATWAGATQRAGFVLVNPLHAAESCAPMEPSPYLPSSRRFLNPLYVRPERIEEYAKLDRHGRSHIRKRRKSVRNAGAGIDRDAVWQAKIDALEVVFQQRRSAARQIAFAHFRDTHGLALHRFALWSALGEVHGPDWRQWPEEFRDVTSAAVAAFAAENSQRVEFFEWLQWVATTQVSRAQSAAREVDMPLGVIADLAVGVNIHGAETWLMPDMFAQGVTVGAPPDQYNQAGQDWGQPPWRPDRLEEAGYEPFTAMVRAALQGVGGVRIDHIIGLFRLWWVPEGLEPSMGTYVRNNHEAMVGILALEASRAGALVVGEDLGTVEPWVRDYLARRGILGTSVLWFESDDAGDPLQAQWWREYAMASVTTHDLPPTLGYLAGDHIRLRESLGLLTEPLDDELADAAAEHDRWIAKLRHDGFLADAAADDPKQIMLALHRFLVTTPSRVLAVSLADAVGERRTQNQPGTIDQYPNWRVSLADEAGQRLSLEEIFTAELPGELAAIMNAPRIG
ncbi:MAG: 4-alpha-glucanotransferase [Arachnia sp.]